MAGTPIPATFYSFGKRTNSTKQPASGGDQMTIIIDDDASSLLNPTIRVQYIGRRTDPAGEPYQYNYVHIPLFRRYYYVTDWAFNGDGTWSGYCKVDPLASWKAEIVASGGIIDRAYMANNTVVSDSTIVDTKYPAKLDAVQYAIDFATSPLKSVFSQGSFVMGCICHQEQGVSAPTVGSVNYYRVDSAEMVKLLASMISQTGSLDWDELGDWGSTVHALDFLGVADTWLATTKTAINPIQYIVSAKWFPFTITQVGSPEPINLGGWSTGAVGQPLLNTQQVIGPISSNGIPDVNSLTPPLNRDYYPPVAPYATYTLKTPWGLFDLDPNVMAILMRTSGGKLQYTYHVDLISGRAVFQVIGNPVFNFPLIRRDVDLALDIPITQITFDKLGQITNWVNLGTRVLNDLPAGVMSGIKSMGSDTRVMGAAVRDTASDIHNIMTFAPTSLSTTTTSAAFTSDIALMLLVITRYKTIDRSPELLGIPIKHSVPSLTGYSGYIQMIVTNFSASCTSQETDDIISNLLEGMYLE